jgi:O6-methylguanine-DNA--protein-cysteine methyltransferase
MSNSIKIAHLATTTESDPGYRWGVERKRALLKKEANA